jgi:hypothetical protein
MAAIQQGAPLMTVKDLAVLPILQRTLRLTKRLMQRRAGVANVTKKRQKN